jgi:hypothetical protein
MKDNSNLSGFDSLGAKTQNPYAELRKLEREKEEWRGNFFALLVFLLFVILSLWVYRNDAPDDRDAIPSQAWSFGEPGE